MVIIRKRWMLSVLLVLGCIGANAQVFNLERQFDGVHKNELDGRFMGGDNVVTDAFFGESVTWTHHFNDRWSIRTGQQGQFNKWIFSLDVMGTYRLPLRRTNLYFDARLLGNFYGKWGVNEVVFNTSVYWEARYMDLRFGGSYVFFHKTHVKKEYEYTEASYTQPYTFTVGIGLNMRPRENKWNLGLFVRNYDDFYYEVWNINWGFRGYWRYSDRMKFHAEWNIRPAGSMSQLATRYESSVKIGIKYVW